MRPIEFVGHSAVLAKNQPQYQPLPVHVDSAGVVTSCWQMEPAELEILVANGGKLWLQQMTFGDLLQPQLPSVTMPPLAD